MAEQIIQDRKHIMKNAFIEGGTGGGEESNNSDWEEVTEPTNRVMIRTLIPTSD